MGYSGWNCEFAPLGTFGHLKVENYLGVAGIEADIGGYPRDGAIILAHEHHFKNTQPLMSVLKKMLSRGYIFSRLDDDGKCPKGEEVVARAAATPEITPPVEYEPARSSEVAPDTEKYIPQFSSESE